MGYWDVRCATSNPQGKAHHDHLPSQSLDRESNVLLGQEDEIRPEGGAHIPLGHCPSLLMERDPTVTRANGGEVNG
jgi:hypothetical protein